MQNIRVQKLITFSPQLYANAKEKAERLGLSFAEYLRMLAASDVKKEIEDLYLLEEKTEIKVGQALKDLQNKKYTLIKTKGGLKKHLKDPTTKLIQETMA